MAESSERQQDPIDPHEEWTSADFVADSAAVRDAINQSLARSLPELCRLSVIIFSIAIGVALTLPSPATQVMLVPLTAICGFVLACWLTLKRIPVPRHLAQPATGLLLLPFLASALLSMWLLRKPDETLYILMILVGFGFFIVSLPWLIAFQALAVSAWYISTQLIDPGMNWSVFYFPMFYATVGGVGINRFRSSRLHGFESLRLENEWRCRQLTTSNARLQMEVTRRELAELSRRNTELEFRTLADSLPLLIWTADEHGVLDYANPEFQSFSGLCPGATWEQWQDRLDDDDGPGVRKRYQLEEDFERKVCLESRRRAQTGETRALLETVVRRPGHDGLSGGLIGSAVDVTELRHKGDLLARARHLGAVATMAAGVTHELNNPLQIISLQCAVMPHLLDDSKSSAELRDIAEAIEAAVDRCNDIVKSVRMFSSQRALDTALIDPEWIIESAVQHIRDAGRGEDTLVTLTVNHPLPPVPMNKTAMEQVLVNLISNSVDAGAPDARIEVIADVDESHVLISIQDYGCGMTATELRHCCDPFYTTRQSSGGTGLGLSVSASIVRYHGGTLEIESAPDCGTTVVVKLPLQSSVTGHPPPPEADIERRTTARVPAAHTTSPQVR